MKKEEIKHLILFIKGKIHYLIGLLLIMPLLFSCVRNEPSYNIINDVFKNIVGIEASYPPKNSSFGKDIEERRISTRHQVVFYIVDTVYSINQKKVKRSLSKIKALKGEYKELIKRFNYSKKVQQLNVEKIRSFDNWVIKNVKKKISDNYGKQEHIRIYYLSFSDFKINNLKKIGCFFVRIVEQGGNSGNESLFFVKKVKDKWVIVKKVFLSMT